MTEPAEIAACAGIIYPKGFPIDDLLRQGVAHMQARGLHVVGVIQEAATAAAGCCETLVLRDIATGRVTTITEDRGQEARGCRLDPQGVAEVAARLEESLAGQPDLLVINRFGKSEMEGRGLRPVLSEALLRGIPVLAGVRDMNAEAWAEFHQGLAVDLPPQLDLLRDWIDRAGSPIPA